MVPIGVYGFDGDSFLQAALAQARVAYEHHLELAPTTELRQLQYAEDDRHGIGKRSRRELAAEYTRRYTTEILDRADLTPIVSALPSSGTAALLCVERDPAACHRLVDHPAIGRAAPRHARAPAPVVMDELDARLHRIGQHHFRAEFRLRDRDRAVVDLRGIVTVRRHAEELVQRRLAPAEPRNDGRQTPYRGHPVFVAQHATATCCRTCLARWHDIPAGRALDDAERGYVVEAICRWIVGQYAPHHPPP